MTRKASCCCGACSVEVQGEPDINAICHCNNSVSNGSRCPWLGLPGDWRTSL